MHFKHITTVKRLASTLTAIALTATTLVPSIILDGTAKAAQLTSRSVTMSNTSNAGSTSSTYTISFANASAGNVQGIVVEFCTSAGSVSISSGGTATGVACTAPTGFSMTAVTPQTIDTVSFTQTIASNKLTMTGASAATAAAAEVYSFTVTAQNPTSTPGTFYARIFTYTTTAAANAYTSTAIGSTPTFVDYGAVAMTTTNNLTVNGIVTETLEFCVGADDGTPAAADAGIQNCSAAGFSSAQTVGIGVIGTTAVSTPASTANGGTNTNGAFLIKTNAVNGATVGYRAVQSSSTGKFKLPGATSATCASNTVSDGCFNSSGTTANTLNGEEFGMAISQMIYPQSQVTATTNLVRDAEYDFTNSNEYAWDDTGTLDQIASSAGSSTKVMDYEVGILKFGAISSPTTPSGAYTVSANFVATATF